MYSEEGGQVFISTHSPDFLNAVRLEELYFLIKKDGYTKIHRASECKVVRELYEAGDLLGQLWRQGLLLDNRSESFRQFVSGVRRFVHTRV